MGCTPFIKLMHKYLDEEISDMEKKELKEHIQKCDQCHRHFKELKETIALVQSTTHTVEVPNDFTNNVMSQLPKEKTSIKYRRWFRKHPMLTAAVVFIFLMMGSLFTTWTKSDQLSVTKQPNLKIEDHLVIVPKGKVVEGDVVVRNGDIKIEGEVKGDVVVINGEKYLASAGKVSGDIEEINAVFDWIWYNMKSIVKDLLLDDSENKNE